MSSELSSFYPGHAHPSHALGPSPFVGDPSKSCWGPSTNAPASHPSTVNSQPHGGSYQNLALGSQQTHHLSAYPASITVSEGQISGIRTDGPPSQPSWQMEQHPIQSNVSQQTHAANFGSARLSQPFFGTRPIQQSTSHSAGRFASESSQSTDSSAQGNEYNPTRQGYQAIQTSLSVHSQVGPEHAYSAPGYPMSRSHSYQNANFHHQGAPAPGNIGNPSFHGYSQQSLPSQAQYSSTGMARTQSGSGYNSAIFPAASESQGGAQYYQNPLAQAGVHQYLPPQQQADHSGGAAPLTGTGYYHQSEHMTNPQGQWTSTDPRFSRISSSDPQFISGPWASSTPPTTGPPPARFG